MFMALNGDFHRLARGRRARVRASPLPQDVCVRRVALLGGQAEALEELRVDVQRVIAYEVGGRGQLAHALTEMVLTRFARLTCGALLKYLGLPRSLVPVLHLGPPPLPTFARDGGNAAPIALTDDEKER